jgi:hypothetical protein
LTKRRDSIVGHYSSFVVKIWVDEKGMMNRGYVQHVSTQQTMHFASLDKMTEFIMGHLGQPIDYWYAPEEGTAVSTSARDWRTRDD